MNTGKRIADTGKGGAGAFTAALPSKRAQRAIVGGYASGPGANPDDWADEVFKGEVTGPWLCCYMLRRFGWPNSGSDDYKQLCSWTLTTPLAGLYLCVTPYLGGGNLHFAVRFDKKVGAEIGRDPEREVYFARRERAIVRWWERAGRKLYSFGHGKAEGDEDVLVKKYAERDGYVSGLWKRTPAHDKHRTMEKIPGRAGSRPMVIWWLGELIREHHPEVKMPGFPKARKSKRVKGAKDDLPTIPLTRFQIQVRAAIKATLRDLLRPTNVRDISFTPFGDIERTPAAVERHDRQKHVEYFEGAGYAPEYWSTGGQAAHRRELKKKAARK